MENFALGLSVALLPQNLLACFGGVFVGTAIGAIPGIGALAAISLLMPLTFARSEEHTSELQSLMRISYAVFCLKKKKRHKLKTITLPRHHNTHNSISHIKYNNLR